jgi:hypothetical protein
MSGSHHTSVDAMVLAAALGAAAAAPAAVMPRGDHARADRGPCEGAGRLVNTTLALDRRHLVYRVEIQTAPDTLTHVEVDAASGTMLHVTSRREQSPFPREVAAP